MTDPKKAETKGDDDRPGMEFAAMLRECLKQKPTSYQDLAELTSLSKGYVSLLAQGRRKPRPEVAERIGRALGLESKEIALLVATTSPDMRTRRGRPATFMASFLPDSGVSSAEPMLVIESVLSANSRTPRVEVHAADRRGAVFLRAETEGPGPGYLAILATNGPEFSWITVTPEEPLQLLPIHADSAVLRLGVADENGQPRLVQEIRLGSRQFLGL
jgi:transcriptional regulator with XRE-family HTH domain